MSSLKTGFAPRPQMSTFPRPAESISTPGGMATRPGSGENVTGYRAPHSSGDRWLMPGSPQDHGQNGGKRGTPHSSGDRWLAPRPPTTDRPSKDSGIGRWLQDLLKRFMPPGWMHRPPESSGDRWLGRRPPPIEQAPQDRPGKGASSNDRWLGEG